MLSCVLQRALVSSLAPLSAAQSLSSEFQHDPPHHGCYSWWSFHGTTVSEVLESLLQLGCILTNGLSWVLSWVKPQLLSMNPLMLGFQLLLRFFLRWSILNSQSAGTQLLFLSLCFQSQYDLDDSSNTKFRCQHNGQPWLSLEHSFCVLNLTKHFPEDFTSMILVFSWSLLVS